MEEGDALGTFFGFLTAILVSMSMWAYVHTFPEGYRPKPRAVLGPGAVIRVEKTPGGGEAISRVTVEKGSIHTTNIPIQEDGKPAGMQASMTTSRETTLPPRVEQQGSTTDFALLAPDVVLAGSNQPDKFGVEGVPVVLLPGVKVEAVEVQQTFNPAEFNPAHTKYIARFRESQTNGCQYVQRVLDAHRLCVGPDRSKSVHRTEARK